VNRDICIHSQYLAALFYHYLGAMGNKQGYYALLFALIFTMPPAADL